MTIINLYTRGLELYAQERPKVAAGNEGTVKINVTFDSTWDGYAKSAVFKTDESPIEHEVVMSSNACVVPKEVLVNEGHIFIGYEHKIV